MKFVRVLLRGQKDPPVNRTHSASSRESSIGDQPSRLLIAEDEHLVAVSLANHIEKLGYEVVGPAANGQEAIELAKQSRPDMALLDVRMPVKDGLETAGTLFRQMRIPVMMISAYANPEYLQRGTEIGIFGYVLKPVSEDLLRVSISVAWARYREHMRLYERVDDLTGRLEERKVIERAKGLLVKNLDISEEEALRRLRHQARQTRRKMVDMAQAVIQTHELMDNKGVKT